jgi:Putative transposase DNA-binding domain
MKRKTSTTPTKIYTYGLPLGPDPDSLPLIDAQIRAANSYQNQLIEIELWRRAQYRKLMALPAVIVTLDARIAELAAELEALRDALGKRRKEARRRVEDKAKSERAKQLRAELKDARGERKAAQQDLREDPEIKASLDAIQAEALIRIKAARAATPCYWGTYLLVERAMEASRKSQTDPRFRRWDEHGSVWHGASYEGEGRFGVQLQGGLTVAALHACEDTRLRIAPVPARAYKTRSGRRNKTRTTLQIRVGSNGRAPLWATFQDLILHRPLPADGVIKETWVMRRRIGTRFRWTLQIALEAQSFAVPPKLRGRRCAINLGWRVRDDGLRVGYLAGSGGERRELILPTQILGRLAHADSLHAIRRNNFNISRDELARWIALQADPLPDWLKKDAQWIPQWKSEARLDKLVWSWASQRLPGDEVIFAALWQWRRQNYHLLQWESHERSRALGARCEHYRLLAVEIATRYASIVLEEIDLRALKRKPRPEDDKSVVDAVKLHQQRAAVGELRAAFILAASNRGTSILKVSSVDNTATCHACGCLCKWDHAVRIAHTCEHCGAKWDQDCNAALNLLSRASAPVPPGDRGALATRATG